MRRRRGELPGIGRELGAGGSGQLLNQANLKMGSTRRVLNQRDLIIGGEGGDVTRGGRKVKM